MKWPKATAISQIRREEFTRVCHKPKNSYVCNKSRCRWIETDHVIVYTSPNQGKYQRNGNSCDCFCQIIGIHAIKTRRHFVINDGKLCGKQLNLCKQQRKAFVHHYQKNDRKPICDTGLIESELKKHKSHENGQDDCFKESSDCERRISYDDVHVSGEECFELCPPRCWTLAHKHSVPKTIKNVVMLKLLDFFDLLLDAFFLLQFFDFVDLFVVRLVDPTVSIPNQNAPLSLKLLAQ